VNGPNESKPRLTNSKMPVFGDDLFVYTTLFIADGIVHYYHIDAQLYGKFYLNDGRFEIYDESNDKRIEDFLLDSIGGIPLETKDDEYVFGNGVFTYRDWYIEHSEIVYRVGPREVILNIEQGTISIYDKNIMRMSSLLTKNESFVDGSKNESQESTTNDQTSHS
jgi:hypothetical protein